MPREIISRLDKLLNKKGWSRYKLAKETGIRKATILAMYNGELKHYPADVLAKIADALEVDDIGEIIAIENKEERTATNTHDKRLK